MDGVAVVSHASARVGDGVESTSDDARRRELFVRRPPEAYARPVVSESALTARLRNPCGHVEFEGGDARSGSHLARLRHADSSRKVEIRIHLPPYTETPLVLKVPMIQHVGDLRDAVIRQHFSHSGVDAYAAYELRLYDEDEQEPDYDCPPFGESLQVGCLNVQDIALCQATAPLSTTPLSPPLAAPSEESSGGELDGVATPEALGSGILAKRNNADRKATANSGRDTGICCRADTSSDIYPSQDAVVRRRGENCSQLPDQCCRSDDDCRSSFELGGGSLRDRHGLQRKYSGQGSSMHAAVRFAERTNLTSNSNLRRSKGLFRRTQSSPQMCSENGVPLVTFGGFEVFSAAPSGGRSGCASSPSTSHRCTNKSGGFERAIGKTASCESCETSNQSHAAVRTRQLQLILPRGDRDSIKADSTLELAGDKCSHQDCQRPIAFCSYQDCQKPIALQIRDDATLEEVLERLSQKHGRLYDPVSFAFERIDDGIRQRLDLHTQVRHLQPNSNVLIVVRKDTPIMAMTPPGGACPCVQRACHAHASELGNGLESGIGRRTKSFPQLDLLCQRPPLTPLFLNEYNNAITVEYVVKIAVRGLAGVNLRGARAVECVLVIERDCMSHRAPRSGKTSPLLSEDLMVTAPAGHSRWLSRQSLLQSPLARFGKHFHNLAEAEPPPGLFEERRARMIRAISREEAPRSFSVTYATTSAATTSGQASAATNSGESTPEGGPVELLYEAQTPTECAEIVARLQFLQSIAK